jgi:hypothetical protein
VAVAFGIALNRIFGVHGGRRQCAAGSNDDSDT